MRAGFPVRSLSSAGCPASDRPLRRPSASSPTEIPWRSSRPTSARPSFTTSFQNASPSPIPTSCPWSKPPSTGRTPALVLRSDGLWSLGEEDQPESQPQQPAPRDPDPLRGLAPAAPRPRLRTVLEAGSRQAGRRAGRRCSQRTGIRGLDADTGLDATQVGSQVPDWDPGGAERARRTGRGRLPRRSRGPLPDRLTCPSSLGSAAWGAIVGTPGSARDAATGSRASGS